LCGSDAVGEKGTLYKADVPDDAELRTVSAQ
jgi:hypothetical protein